MKFLSLKTSVMYFSVLFLLSTIGWTVAPMLAGSRLVCDQPDFSFGTIPVGASVQHDFVIRNRGKEALTLAGAESDCSCTVITAIENKTLQPGASTVIAVKFQSQKPLGPRHQTILIRTKKPHSDHLVLQLRGDLTAEAQQ